MLNPLLATSIERSIIPETFIILSFTIFEEMDMKFLNFLAPYLKSGSDFFKII
jgi:hypothetical protein